MSNEYQDLVNQAHRLLRTRWDNPTSLAEELYSMLIPKVGPDFPGGGQQQSVAVAEVQRRLDQAQQFFTSVDQSTTVQKVKATVVQPLAIEQAPPLPPRPAPPAAPEGPPPRPVEVPNFPRPPTSFLTIPPSTQAPFVSAPPLPPNPFLQSPLISPTPMAYSRPDLEVPKLPDLDWTLPVDNIPFGGGGGGGGILGRVVSGDGDTYVVDLYENGRRSAATRAGVTVIIPQIAEGEDIPGGTWIAPIIEVTSDAGDAEFDYQPPIWLG